PPAQSEPRRRRRHLRLWLALCHGTQLQPDRHLLQSGTGDPDWHERAAPNAGRVRGSPCSGKREAGLLPIMQWGSARSGMGLAFPLQALMASIGPVEPINDWIFQKPGATINTPEYLNAAH